MLFRAGVLYKHRNFLDACFRVNKTTTFDHPDHGIVRSLKVSWYLQKNLMPMGFTDRIKIVQKQLKNYTEIKE